MADADSTDGQGQGKGRKKEAANGKDKSGFSFADLTKLAAQSGSGEESGDTREHRPETLAPTPSSDGAPQDGQTTMVQIFGKFVRQRYVERMPISAMRDHPRNPHLGVDDKVAESIEANGFYGAVFIQESSGYVIAGHTRKRSAVKLGFTHLPAFFLDVDDETALRILLVDNRIGELATYDEIKLAQLLDTMSHQYGSLMGTGYTNDDYRSLVERLGDDVLKQGGMGTLPPEEGEDGAVDPFAGLDSQRRGLSDEEMERVADPSGGGDDYDITPAEEGEPTRTLPGDLWRLGSHRLLVGDSTNSADLARLLEGARADLVFTDPPYGVAYQSKLSVEEAAVRHRRLDGLEVANDAMTPEQTQAFLGAAFQALAEHVLKPGGVFYVCSPSGDMETIFRNCLDAARLRLRQSIIWVKDYFVMGRQDYHWRHESILYGWAEGAAHFFVNDRTQNTVWEYPRPWRSKEHPTMKPIVLCARAIANSSREGEVVFDGFGGSGSTLLACERTGRVCYTAEITTRYADVILRRWEAESGAEAELLERVTPEAAAS